MKYRMEENERLGGMRLMRGDKVISTRGLSLDAVAYHEAAVEFWQEIERLRAANAEQIDKFVDVAMKTLCPAGNPISVHDADKLRERLTVAFVRIARTESAEGGEGGGE